MSTDLKPTVSLKNFRFWCQKVLPLVYDDSISYYEVLGKMVVYLNQVIDNVNADIDNVNTLKDAFIELQEYVAEAIQYDISDLQEIARQCVASANLASESATSAQESAESADEDAQTARQAAQDASGSAINASNSATNAIEAGEQARGYASSANTSALNAANSALNAVSMADQASNYAKETEGYAVGKQNGVDVGSDSVYYQNNAKYYKEDAEDSADSADHFKDEANTSALVAEGNAVGKQNGVDVDSSSPYYHNNAKYYAEQAGQASGLSVSLDSLTNVDIQNPAEGQTLVYDSTGQKWVNSDEAQAITSLVELTDTDIANPSAGQVLMYDSTNQEWVNSAEKEIAISQSAPSDPATKLWIDETQVTPISIPTEAEVNTAISNINDQISQTNTVVNTKANSVDVNNALNAKEDKPTVVTESAPTSVTLVDNREYYFTNVSDLTITYPSGNFEVWIYLETATSGTVAVTLPTSGYIGDAPSFDVNEKWEISIKNGNVIAGKIE